MSAATAISPTLTTPPEKARAGSFSPDEIDASCRWPVLLLCSSAVFWLVVSAGLSLITSLKFHGPDFLANCPWLTYGRVRPASLSVFLYGFASQAALGVALWMVCRLGRVKLVSPLTVFIACRFWNLGVLVGLIGILIGDSTGFEWLEMPRYASPILFFSYAAIGVCALLTFHERRERELYPAQWFLLAALFWFPWIYSTANFLLVFRIVRGVVQFVVNTWFMTGLRELWLTSIGLAIILYFIPKTLGRPLHSRYLALFAFWLIALFGGWGGLYVGAPVPRWLVGLSTMASVMMIVPIVATATNICLTMLGANSAKAKLDFSYRFVVFGAIAYLVAGLVNSAAAICPASTTTRFSLFSEALNSLTLYGFVAMVLFGAIYYIVPRLLQQEFASAGWVKLHFWTAVAGVVLVVAPLALGGFRHAAAMNNPDIAFVDVMKSTLPYLRITTLGLLLLMVGNVALLLNLGWTLARCCQTCCLPAMASLIKPVTAEART